MISNNLSKNYFPSLTGVRALAAYMVFFHHFIPNQGVYSYVNIGYIFSEMHIGVTLFFVLSGFLIHNRYNKFSEINFTTYWKYFSARIARIFPVFFILTTFTFVYNYFFDKSDHGLLGKNLALWILNVSLLKGFFSGLNFSGIAQSWSLTVEFSFYALAPLLFFKSRNFFFYFTVSVFLFFLGYTLVFIFNKYPLHGFFGDSKFILSYSFFGRSMEFFAGCFLSSKLESFQSRNERMNLDTFLGLFFIILTIYVLSLLRIPMVYGVHSFWGTIINNIILPVFVFIFFRGLILEKTLVSRLFSSSFFQLLGKSSYVFYLIHVGFIEKILSHYVNHNLFFLFILLNIISIGIYLGIEEPLNSRTKQWLQKINFSTFRLK